MKRGEHPVLCQECQQRTANVHYTKVVNGQKTEYHLCEQCAREKGEIDLSFGFDPGFSIHNLLAGLLDMDNPVTQLSKTAAADQRCPSCGLNYAEFSQSGRLVAPIATALLHSSWNRCCGASRAVLNIMAKYRNVRMEF